MQLSFLDPTEQRLRELSQHGDPLERLNAVIDWQLFKPTLTRIDIKPRKSNAGRPVTDRVLMFKILILKKYYALSDEGIEYQIRDRLSFMRFLGLTLESDVPDANTLRVFSEALTHANLIVELFETFNIALKALGVEMSSGQIIDATFVQAPRQRNNREDNDTIKQNAIPLDWGKAPNKLAQKDTDARWTKKNNVAHYGYKDHANVDKATKLIAAFTVTDASVHDSQALTAILRDEGGDVYADSAYASDEIAGILYAKNIGNQIHERAYQNKPLTQAQENSNKIKSKTRARVEHVFGTMKHTMKGFVVRSIGIARAKTNIGLMNLAYNLHRVEVLIRLKTFRFDRVVAPVVR